MRDFRKYPKRVYSVKQTMRIFVDCINNANIFDEKIPYMVIHQGEHRMSSKMELKLNFKENIINNLKEKNMQEKNKTIFNYFVEKIKKLNNIEFNYDNVNIDVPDFFKSSEALEMFLGKFYEEPKYNVVGNHISIVDKRDDNCYYKYNNIIFSIWLINDNKKIITDNCELEIRLVNMDKLDVKLIIEI